MSQLLQRQRTILDEVDLRLQDAALDCSNVALRARLAEARAHVRQAYNSLGLAIHVHTGDVRPGPADRFLARDTEA